MGQDADKTYIFDLIYGNRPDGDPTPNWSQVVERVNRRGQVFQPTDYSGLEIQIAREMERTTTPMTEQAIDLETGRLYDGGQIPPWAIRLTEPVGLRSWCRYLHYGKIKVANCREAMYTRDDRVHFVHRASNVQEAVTGILTRLAAGDPHSVFSSTPPGFNDHAVAIVRSDRDKATSVQSGEYEIVYETDLPGLTKATLFWLQGSVLFPRCSNEKPRIALVKDTATNRWALRPRTPWTDPEENWTDPLRGVLNLLICVDTENYKSHMKALQEARRFYSDTTRGMPGIQTDPPYHLTTKNYPTTKNYHMVVPARLKEITMTLHVEKNREPPPSPFRPEEFRTTQHLGGMGLANMRHPAFERAVRPVMIPEAPVAATLASAWEMDPTPQARDRRDRFIRLLQEILPSLGDDPRVLPEVLERPLAELRLRMVPEPYAIVFKDTMDRTRHPGYALSLRVSIQPTHPAGVPAEMTALRRAMLDTLRSIVKAG